MPHPSVRLNKDVLEKIREDSLTSEKESGKETETSNENAKEESPKVAPVSVERGLLPEASGVEKKKRSGKQKLMPQRSQSVDVSIRKTSEFPVIGSNYGFRNSQRDYLNQEEIEEILKHEPHLMKHNDEYFASLNESIFSNETFHDSSLCSSSNQHALDERSRIKSDSTTVNFPFNSTEKRRANFMGQKSVSCDVPGSELPQVNLLDKQNLTVEMKIKTNSDTYIRNDPIKTELYFPVPKHEIHKLIKLDPRKVQNQFLSGSARKFNDSQGIRVVSDGVVKWKRRESLSPDNFNNVLFVKRDPMPSEETSGPRKAVKEDKGVCKQSEHGRKKENKNDKTDKGEIMRTSSLKKMMHFHSMKPVHHEDGHNPIEGEAI